MILFTDYPGHTHVNDGPILRCKSSLAPLWSLGYSSYEVLETVSETVTFLAYNWWL
jgi:hypothetical protein